jgi:hypothetical protein
MALDKLVRPISSTLYWQVPAVQRILRLLWLQVEQQHCCFMAVALRIRALTSLYKWISIRYAATLRSLTVKLRHDQTNRVRWSLHGYPSCLRYREQLLSRYHEDGWSRTPRQVAAKVFALTFSELHLLDGSFIETWEIDDQLGIDNVINGRRPCRFGAEVPYPIIQRSTCWVRRDRSPCNWTSEVRYVKLNNY